MSLKYLLFLFITLLVFTGCENKSTPESLQKIYAKGQIALKNREYEKAIQFYKEIADNKQELNDIGVYYRTISQFAVGIVYLNKLQNIPKGLKYLELAADNGNPSALENLSVIYRDGLYGIPKNSNLSWTYFFKEKDAKKAWSNTEMKVREWGSSLVKNKH